MNDNAERDPRLFAIPDTHGHPKGEHKPYAEERPLPLTARMLFLWFYHACRRGYPRFLMVTDHMNYLTFEDPAAVNLVRRALKLAQAGDLYGAAETANVDVAHAAVVSEGLRRGMRYSIGAEVDNDPRSRPDAQNIVDAMRPDGIIRSVHFIPIAHPVHGENWAWPFDNPEFREFHDTVPADQLWQSYINALVDAIERLPGHIVGHFFVPAVFGAWPDDAKLEEYEDRVLDAAGARGMAIEFNTRFLYRDNDDVLKARYLAANKRLLRKAKERGVQIAIGSDAHSPRDQAGAFEIVLDVLDELEINEIVFPMGGQLRRVALRVVREPEPEPIVEPPAPEPVKAPVESAPAEAVKPPRKARPAAKAARPPETAPERETKPPAKAAPKPPAPQRAEKSAPPAPAPAKAKPPAKAAVKPAPEPAPKPAPKPAPRAKAAAAPKASAKSRLAPAAKTKPAAKASAKAAAAKKPAKKTSPARATAKKTAPKRAAPVKKAVKKAAPARAAAKKAAPKKAGSKKTVAKKAPGRGAPARKGSAKKAAAKKRR